MSCKYLKVVNMSSSARFSDAFSNSDMYRFSNGRASMRDSAMVSANTDTTLVLSDMSEQDHREANVSVETTPIGISYSELF